MRLLILLLAFAPYTFADEPPVPETERTPQSIQSIKPDAELEQPIIIDINDQTGRN